MRSSNCFCWFKHHLDRWNSPLLLLRTVSSPLSTGLYSGYTLYTCVCVCVRDTSASPLVGWKQDLAPEVLKSTDFQDSSDNQISPGTRTLSVIQGHLQSSCFQDKHLPCSSTWHFSLVGPLQTRLQWRTGAARARAACTSDGTTPPAVVQGPGCTWRVW